MHPAITCLLAIACCAVTTARGEEPNDYASLRREAVAGLQQLKALTARAQEAGIETSRERTTIVTAEQFLKFAEWDFRHPAKLAEACNVFQYIDQAYAEKYSRELPLRELREVRMITDAATAELQAVMEQPSLRREVPEVDLARLNLVDGYFHFNGRPLFPHSFFWLPNSPELKDAYGAIGSVFVTPGQKVSPARPARFNTEGRDPDGEVGYVFLNHGPMPPWAVEAYDNIGFAKRAFTAYDIDHPGTRDVWKGLLQDIVPQLAGRNVTRGGYMLANEPHWFTATGEWNTGPVSEFTKAKFRAWLAGRHGNVANLNQLWKTAFESFDDVTIDIPMDPRLRGTAVWYDWCRFNMDRVTDYFSFLKEEIRKHDKQAAVHIKIMPQLLTTPTRSHGIDMESLVRLQDIVGCDVKVINASHSEESAAWTRRYALHWHEMAVSFDFFKSVAPRKMIFDSEFHGLSTVNWRDEDLSPQYVRCVLWLCHLHGMGMNLTWFWGRDETGAPVEQTARDFYASNLTQPLVMNAFGRTMKELNAFAPEVVSLASRPKHVRLFYSESQAINDEHYIHMVNAVYNELYHEGFPLGFVTARMLSEASENTSLKQSVVVLAGAEHMTVAELDALRSYVSQGGTLAIAKYDEYGRPHIEPLVAMSDRLIRFPGEGKSSLVSVVSDNLRAKGLLSPVVLKETNAVGEPGCVWRTCPYEDGHLLLVINLGKSAARLELAGHASSCRDLLTGAPHPSTFQLPSLGVELLHVRQQK